MTCLSLRQPWCWIIFHLAKDIENRTWASEFRGEFLIHASKGCSMAEWESAKAFCLHGADMQGIPSPEWARRVARMPTPRYLTRGGIVGKARITGCLKPGPSSARWHMEDQFGYELRDVCELVDETGAPRIIPYSGRLGFFQVSDPLVAGAVWRAVA